MESGRLLSHPPLCGRHVLSCCYPGIPGCYQPVVWLDRTGFGDVAVAEMTATGGVILVGIGISNLLQIKKIRTGSFLPAIFIAVLIVLLLNTLGVTY